MKTILFIAVSLIVTGCNYEMYRYPCQDPANWGNEECQKPKCEVSRTCPEHIFPKDKELVKSAVVNSTPKTISKGECND